MNEEASLKGSWQLGWEAITSSLTEIEELQKGVAALDKSVAESTEMRKKEHEDVSPKS